jgi:ABC-2 type transport system permease protein
MADAGLTLATGTPGAPALPAAWRVLAGQVRYQLLLLMRTPRALIAGIVMPGLLLALRLGRVHHVGAAAAGPVAGLVAGLVVFGILGTAYLTHASGLVIAREDGVLRRWRATPLPGWGYFTGRIIATVLIADASGLVLVLAGVAMAGLHVTAGMAVGLAIAVTLGALAWASVGTAVTAAIPTAQSANPILTLTFLPVLLFSGSLGSPSGLPHALKTVMSYLPAQPVIDAASHALSNPGFTLMPARDLLILVCWMLAGLLISLRFFRWIPHRPSHSARG